MTTLRGCLISLGILLMLAAGLGCGTSQEAVNEAALAEACGAIEDANALQRQQMAWEIVRHQNLSPFWSSEQIIAEVEKVAEQLE